MEPFFLVIAGELKCGVCLFNDGILVTLEHGACPRCEINYLPDDSLPHVVTRCVDAAEIRHKDGNHDTSA